MAKASQKSASTNLGTKRNCPKCSTKFYDFNKEEVVCPKCGTELSPQDLIAVPAVEIKKPKVAEKIVPPEALLQADEIATEDADVGFESVEDLADEEEDLVEDLGVDDENEF